MLPPGQQLAAPHKWPTVGERAPALGPEPWSLTLEGCVESVCCWTIDQLRAIPQVERVEDIHCVTRWSKLAVPFRGLSLAHLLAEARPLPTARFVSLVARSDRGHSTSLPLQDALELDTLLALEAYGQPLAVEHGGPLRVVVPHRYFYKSLKWLARIELLADDRLGYWEREAGYHNNADPWFEQRFIASRLSRAEVARLIAGRDFSHRELLGIEAAGHDLQQLNARGAQLRNADFRHCNLARARFDGANLSNARLQGANLSKASLYGADVEGVDFSGADLRGADLRRVSLLGATFVGESSAASLSSTDAAAGAGAQLDASTRIDSSAIEQLTPLQADYVRQTLQRR